MSSQNLNRLQAIIRVNRLFQERRFADAGKLASQDKEAFDLLVEMLRVAKSAICFSAAVALIGTGQKALPPLIEALEDGQFIVRQAAALALGDVPDGRAVAPLVERLEDVHEAVRQAAAVSLGKIGDPAAVAPLIDALTDERSIVRRMAASSLGRIGDERALPELERVVRADPETAESAEASIAAIRGTVSGEC